MAIYAVMAVSDPEKIERAIKANYPAKDVYELKSGEWLIAVDNTAYAVSQTLGLDAPDKKESAAGLAMVARLEAYWGYHNQSLWDWMSLKERQ